MSATSRRLCAAGIAAGLVLAGCGGSDTPDAGQEERRSAAAEPNALPEPGEPRLQLKSGEFPITVRPVGVEVSPSLRGEPADPGDTQLGVMLEYRGTMEDRPTPVPGFYESGEWTVLYPPAKGAECGNATQADGMCADGGPSRSAFFDKHSANSQGMRLFEPKLLEENVEGDIEDSMEPGTGYYVELFTTIPESLNLADIKVCATSAPEEPEATPAQEGCIDLGGLPQLPKRG